MLIHPCLPLPHLFGLSYFYLFIFKLGPAYGQVNAFLKKKASNVLRPSLRGDGGSIALSQRLASTAGGQPGGAPGLPLPALMVSHTLPCTTYRAEPRDAEEQTQGTERPLDSQKT